MVELKLLNKSLACCPQQQAGSFSGVLAMILMCVSELIQVILNALPEVGEQGRFDGTLTQSQGISIQILCSMGFALALVPVAEVRRLSTRLVAAVTSACRR